MLAVKSLGVEAAAGAGNDAGIGPATAPKRERRTFYESVDVGRVAGDGKNLVGGIYGRNPLGALLEAIRNASRTCEREGS